jgi:hypothetical protein
VCLVERLEQELARLLAADVVDVETLTGPRCPSVGESVRDEELESVEEGHVVERHGMLGEGSGCGDPFASWSPRIGDEIEVAVIVHNDRSVLCRRSGGDQVCGARCSVVSALGEGQLDVAGSGGYGSGDG